MYKLTIGVDYEELDNLVQTFLIDMLDDVENNEEEDVALIEGLNRVIAYMSVPGEWKDGKFDCEI